MRFTATKSDLLTGINTAIKAVPSTTTMPILRCFLLEADRNGITMSSNDMELAIQTHVPADVTEGGTIAIDAKMLSDIVRKLPSSDVSVTTDENLSVTIKSGKAKFQIGGMSGKDFTGLPDVKAALNVSIPQNEFRRLIQSTIFSVGQNESHKAMTGERIEIKDGYMRVTALDGHRIAISRCRIDSSAGPVTAIVPSKTLNDIIRIIGNDNDELEISIAQNHIMFRFAETTVTSRLIDGDFYNTDQMIPKESSIELTVNRSYMIECVERAGLFIRENDKKPVILNITDDSMNISVTTPLGSMDETVDVSKTGDDICIGFNPRFVADALKAVPDDEVTLYMNGQKQPCIICDAEQTYLYMILPVNFVR